MKNVMAIGLCISLFFILAIPTHVFAKGGSAIPQSVFQSLDEQKATGITPEALKAKRQQFFNDMDTNNDGLVSKDEFTAYEKKIFTLRDVNKDGVLTLNEIKPEGKVYFAKLDINKDGKVNAEEASTKMDELFKAMDGSDQDGFITKDEYFLFWAKNDSQAAKGKAKG